MPRRVVCDVNVLVSAVGRRGATPPLGDWPRVPPRTGNPWLDTVGILNSGRDFALVTSPHILWNVADVLINHYGWAVGMTKSYVALLLEMISQTQGIYLDPTSQVADCAADDEDNRILELALDADADLVVTEDSHLLELSPWRGVPIMTAKDFAARADIAIRARARREGPPP